MAIKLNDQIFYNMPYSHISHFTGWTLLMSNVAAAATSKDLAEKQIQIWCWLLCNGCSESYFITVGTYDTFAMQ